MFNFVRMVDSVPNTQGQCIDGGLRAFFLAVGKYP